MPYIVSVVFISLISFTVLLLLNLYKIKINLKIVLLNFLLLSIVTIIFDNIMISLGLFQYNTDLILGIYILKMPLEDLGYTLVAAILMPAVWSVLAKYSEKDLKIIIKSSRPISWVNTAFPFALVYLVNSNKLDENFWWGVSLFLIPYNLLMYGINDVFDYESDIKNPRKGGVEGAVLPKHLHNTIIYLSIFMTSIPALGLLLNTPSGANNQQNILLNNIIAPVVLILSILNVAAYSMPPIRFKERSFLDSISSSLHFVSPALVAMLYVSADWSFRNIMLIVSFFMWGCASHLFGAVQDIVSDRQAGISSSASVWGAKKAIRLTFIYYLLSFTALILLGGVFIFLAIFVLPYITMVVKYWNINDEDSAVVNSSWRKFLWFNQITGAAVTIFALAHVFYPHIFMY